MLEGYETDSASISNPLRNTLRFVKDPIHDYIPLHPLVSAFVDTRQFQRLRAIKQLGTSYYVWPGASHNRFEHCLGVACLGRLMVEHLQKDQPELGITARDVKCVELAALCHDLGHGPWSHVWDDLFIPIALKGKKWRHEDASEMMFDYLISDNDIEINSRDATFVKALIAADPGRCNPPEKAFLFEIVSNKRNGIDVDKFDYIARDGHAIGEKHNLSLSRLIQSARVIDDQICYDIKDANQIYELCYTRFSYHKRIYNHKTAKAIEYMIVDGLLAADPHLHIAEQVDKPEKYVFLTDDIMPRIENTTDPELAESRAIFDRIRTRDLYKCVDYKAFGWEYRELCATQITPERIVQAAKELSAPTCTEDVPETVDDTVNADSLEVKHVIVDFSPMHYGMKEKNPIDFIRFYSKHNPDRCAQAGPGDLSDLMPRVFGEVLLRIYTRDARYFGIIQAGYRAVLADLPARVSPAEPPTAAEEKTPSPPQTPRTHSRNTSFTLPSGFSSANVTPVSKVFSVNNFTTVAKTYVPPSPTRQHRRPRSRREGDPESPVKKQRML